MVNQNEIYKETTHHLSIGVRNGEVEAVDSSIEHGMAARVIKDARFGFAYTTKPSIAENELIKMAEIASEGVAEDKELEFPKSSNDAPFEKSTSVDLSSLTNEEKIALVKEFETYVYKFDKRIKSVRKASYDEFKSDIIVTNSNGVNASFSTGICSIGITPIAEDGKESEWASEVEYAFDPKKLNIKEVAESAARKAVLYLNGRKIPSAKSPAIFDREVTGELLDVIASSFFADSIYKKRSPFVGKEGKSVYSKEITIVDDATLKGGFSSVPYDSEGVKTRKNVLVEEGAIKSFLADTIYGKKIGKKSTGSSTRPDFKQVPKVGFHNLHVVAGKLSLNELKKEMGSGFYITDVLGLHTANIVTGDFSIGASGFWVKNGIDQHSVKGVTIAGNLHEIFKRVQKVGNDLKFWYSGGAPSVLIEEIAISGE